LWEADVNLRFLETFLWAARLGSFSRAAEKLNTTQAAISNRIATLEQELGVRLFDREARHIRLTQHGHRALAQADQIVRLANDFREAMSDPAALGGTVRIGTVDTVVYGWLPELIQRMQARYPSVELDLNVDTSVRLAQKIRDGSIDIAIIMGPVLEPDIRSVEVCTFESCWVASTRLDLPETDISLSDIAGYPLLTFSKGSQPHKALLDLLAEAGVDDIRIYNSNSLAIMSRLVSSGVGIGALPVVLVEDLVAAEIVRMLPIKPAVPSLTFHTVYQERPDNAWRGLSRSSPPKSPPKPPHAGCLIRRRLNLPAVP
jgi:DNA-binding transcriptional LysR family regulator